MLKTLNLSPFVYWICLVCSRIVDLIQYGSEISTPLKNNELGFKSRIYRKLQAESVSRRKNWTYPDFFCNDRFLSFRARFWKFSRNHFRGAKTILAARKEKSEIYRQQTLNSQHKDRISCLEGFSQRENVDFCWLSSFCSFFTIFYTFFAPFDFINLKSWKNIKSSLNKREMAKFRHKNQDIDR